MNTPSPLIPQGTFPPTRGKSHIRIAVFTILAIHLVLLGALLMAGCKKTADTTSLDPTSLTNNYGISELPSPDTNVVIATQPPSYAPPNVPARAPGPTPTISAIPGSTFTPGLPPPLPGPSETLGASGIEHIVVKGDSFYLLGKKYGISYKAIAEANPGVDPTRLKIGQKVRIPPASVSQTASLFMGSNGPEKTYTVKSGDTLMKIARSYGVTVKGLRSANRLRTDQIKVGQKLVIPAKESAPDNVSSSAGSTGSPVLVPSP